MNQAKSIRHIGTANPLSARGLRNHRSDFPMSVTQRLQAHEFERIGHSTARIAHDLNNFILGILRVVGEVSHGTDPQSPHRESPENRDDSGTRGRRLE
jgi:hypothetical protein